MRAAVNPAAELGPQRFDWWKDWRGQDCAIIASGPSTRREDVERLRGRMKVIAIKQTVDLAPWADVVYACDAPWWDFRRGLPDYNGLKLAYAAQACARFADLKRVEIPDVHCDRLLLDTPGSVGAGGNSGFQAFNLAVQFGVQRILLIGFDMTDRSGAHYYGRNNWAMANNPSLENFRRWIAAFNGLAADIDRLGIEVVNASSASALKCFPKMNVQATMSAWGYQ